MGRAFWWSKGKAVPGIVIVDEKRAGGEQLQLLAACALPISDMDSCVALRLFSAYEGAALAGVVGLEMHGRLALLRSLAVAPGRRGTGLGKRLVAYAEKHAAEDGIESLYLLTTTAAPFFEKLGYETASRADAPPAIRATAQFSGLCPDSSSFMVKRSIRR